MLIISFKSSKLRSILSLFVDTLVLEKDDKRWEIVHTHASAMVPSY
ncbi:MAG: nuclear transport factor 2 family protein [Colwellia sp.]|nr:nuclear transport factor 2 family protein [Colwellia sp.]